MRFFHFVLGALVGTLVRNQEALFAAVESTFENAVSIGDGIFKVALNCDDYSFLSGGIAVSSNDPDHYIVYSYRGQVQLFMKREHALPVKGCEVIVYTREAFLSDPEVGDDAIEKIGDATHVVVAVLGNSGEPSGVSPDRLVSNMAGGSNRFSFLKDGIKGLNPGNGSERAKCDLKSIQDFELKCFNLYKEAVASDKYSKNYCVVYGE